MTIMLNMDTFEILNILKSDQVLGQILLGVFPSDKLPDIIQRPAALVMNLDSSDQMGSHWVCMYFDELDACEYFDSYGLPPMEATKRYLLTYVSKIRWNKKCVQKLFTSTCGQICIYFLIWRSRGIPMTLITTSLEKSFTDEFVTGFVNNLFKVNTVVMDKNFIVNQFCQRFI